MTHYVTSTASNWVSAPFDSREDAQRWIDSLYITQSYKDAHYRIVSRDELFRRHREGKRFRGWVEA